MEIRRLRFLQRKKDRNINMRTVTPITKAHFHTVPHK